MSYQDYLKLGGDLYHAAPTIDRARIQQHGLQPSNPNINPMWTHQIDDQPQGVYGLGTPEVWPGFGQGGPRYDLWRIPSEQIRERFPDPLLNYDNREEGEWVVPHEVRPELHQPGPESYEPPKPSGPDPHDWVNYHDWHELGNPSDEDFKKWKIGEPVEDSRFAHVKMADKLHDFLMNPKSRPDLQTPEAQEFLQTLERLHDDKTDALMPWLTREWKKGRLLHDRDNLRLRYMVYPYGPPAPGESWAQGEQRHTVSPGMLSHWADFMRSNHPVRRALGDIMQHDVGSLHKQIRSWEEAMEQEAQAKALEGGQVVHTTPEGYTVRQLTTPEELTAEGDAMGHCVGSYALDVANGDSMIYSLRDPQGMPHATVEIEPRLYQHPYEGITDEPYGGDEGREQNEPIPHGGQVVQIQGKANREPIPEYKQQLAHWFNTFDPEDRPQWSDSAWDRDERHFRDIDDIEDHHLLGPNAYDEYGLKHQQPDWDWDGIVGSTLRDQGGWGNHMYDHADAPRVYRAARAHGQIPQLAQAVERFGDRQQESFNRLLDQNFEYLGAYPYEEDFSDPEEYKEALDNYEENERALMDEHPGMQATNHFRELLNPHYNPEAQAYQNEPYRAPPTQLQFPPQTFS